MSIINSKKKLNILDLQDEIFYFYIFPFILKGSSYKYTSTGEYLFFVSLKLVCKRFYHIIKSKNLWIKPLKDLQMDFVFKELSNKTNYEICNFDFSIWPAKPFPIVFDLVSTNLISLNISKPNSLPSL